MPISFVAQPDKCISRRVGVHRCHTSAMATDHRLHHGCIEQTLLPEPICAQQIAGHLLEVLAQPDAHGGVAKLVGVLHRLVDEGHTVLVIEHNLDVAMSCDHLIDLGPEGGDEGGTVVASGTPEELCAVSESYTGNYLKKHMSKRRKAAGNPRSRKAASRRGAGNGLSA